VVLINVYSLLFLFIIGLVTTFFSSARAIMEEDIKKVVALRTLSQIGFSIITLGLNLYFLSFLHLLSHALFKSCLFFASWLFDSLFFWPTRWPFLWLFKKYSIFCSITVNGDFVLSLWFVFFSEVLLVKI